MTELSTAIAAQTELNGLPVYYCDYTDSSEIELVSFVDEPAVDVSWIALSKQPQQPLYLSSDEYHTVTGVVLRAGYPIYRHQEGREFYIVFTKESIRKYVERFFREKRTSDVNLDHSDKTDGCYLIESYFVGRDNRFGVEEGSWVCTYKVDNSDVWKDIKDGKFKGFSVEATVDLREDDFEFEIDQILK